MAKEELIFADYLNVLNRHKLTVAAVVCLGLLGSFLMTGKEKVIYKSRARIKIQRQINVTQMFDELLVSSGDPLENYLIEISGHTVISGAAARLVFPETPDAPAIAALHDAVSVERIAKTDLLDIYLTGVSPEESMARCAAVVESFIEQHDIAIRRNAQEILDTIQGSYDKLSRSLSEKESEILEKLGPYALRSARDDELAPMRRRLAEIRVQLQQLRLSGNYTDEYPGIVRLESESRRIEETIQETVSSELSRQTQLAEYERYKSLMEKISEFFAPRIEEAKIAASKKNEIIHIVEPPSEGRKVGTGRTNKIIAGGLLSLMLGIVLAFVSDHLDTSVRNVGEIERLFKLPVLGIIPHFSPQDEARPFAGHRLGSRLRGMAPLNSARILRRAFSAAFKAGKKPGGPDLNASKGLIVPVSPRSPATEAYRTLRTNIMLHLKDGNNAVVFTSASPEEGKSTTISNLAVAFAQGGKRTLLADCNMRRPQMYRIFGLERERGISDILLGDIKWTDAVKDYSDVALGDAGQGLATAPGMDNLYYITCGGRTIHPAEWLSQPILAGLIEEWKAAYDIVLLDAPPTLPVPDSVILSMVVRQTILVYQVGVTPRESVRRAISALQNTGATIAGIVLNDLRPSSADDAEFYQYRHYYGRKD